MQSYQTLMALLLLCLLLLLLLFPFSSVMLGVKPAVLQATPVVVKLIAQN